MVAAPITRPRREAENDNVGVSLHPEYGFPLRAQADRGLMARRVTADAVGRARVRSDLSLIDGTSIAAGSVVDVFKPTSGELGWRRDVVVVLIAGAPRRLSPGDLEPLDDGARSQVEHALEVHEEKEKALKPVGREWVASFFGVGLDEAPAGDWALEQIRSWDLSLVGSVLMSAKPKGMGPPFKTYRLLHNWLASESPSAVAWAEEQRAALQSRRRS